MGGLFYDKFGPFPTAVGSAVMVFLGFFGMYLSSIRILPTNYLFVGFCALVFGHGSSWSYVVALNTNVANFDAKDRGKVIEYLCYCFYVKF